MRRDQLKQRREEAAERQIARDERGDAGQLKRLEAAGHGHCKEADRLRARIEKASDGK